MRISSDDILSFLREQQARRGGFTGSDMAELARQRSINPEALSKRILRLVGKDPSFQGLRYLGQRAPALTLEDYSTLCDTLQQSPLPPPRSWWPT